MRPILLMLLFAYNSNALKRNYTFANDFWFGVATASYQVEGAWNIDGKGENIWDRFTHTNPKSIADNSNGDIACDSYHKTEADVKLLAELGVQFHRFSISWSRILPKGHANEINEDGIKYYNNLIDALLAKRIKPLVTIYHWDLPQPLQELGGWTNPLMADYYADYANLLFKKFGDRVKTWLTFNESYMFCVYGYSLGIFAPGYKQDGIGAYLCGHTVLRAHAKAYEIYKRKYKSIQRGRVGITLISTWHEPVSPTSRSDIEAAERSNQMNLGWFAHPIYSKYGDYPPIMRERIDTLSLKQGYIRSRLPKFTKEEIKSLRGSSDFFGLNHYTADVCTMSNRRYAGPSVEGDVGANCYIPIGWDMIGLNAITPWSLRKLLKWIKREYNDPEIIITENGYGDWTGVLEDCGRISFYNEYLQSLLESIYEDGCNVTGYSAWSFLDNFEWSLGYTQKYGLVHVDFDKKDRPRTKKMSYYSYRNIIKTRKIDVNFTPSGWRACNQKTKRLKHI